MRYQHLGVEAGTDAGVKGVRRGVAFLIDGALVSMAVLALDREKFSGLPADLFLLGVYRVLAHSLFSRTVGKAIVGLVVAADGEAPGHRAVRAWWRRCLLRELPFYGLPAAFLAGQLALGFNLSPVAGGGVLVLLVLLLSAEVLFLVEDAASARRSDDGRALHDRLAGTVVRRRSASG